MPFENPIRLSTRRALLAALGGIAIALPAWSVEDVSTGADDLAVGTATHFSQTMARWFFELAESRRSTAQYSFEDDERFDLRLAPFPLEGLLAEDMGQADWLGLHAAFGQVLSADGLAKVDTIRSLEREVRESEDGFFGFLMGRIRRPMRYFLAIFGDPDPSKPWGLRFDGHHVSLNWTAVPGKPLSVTPLFLGGQPREVAQEMERAGLRVLAEEEDRALELLRSLSATQRDTATIELKTGSALTMSRPMFVGAGRQLGLPESQGLARSDMTPEQQIQLDALVDVYLANFVAVIADEKRSRIQAQADATTVVFAGSGVAGEPSYYRVQGETFLVEFDNTAPRADHIHVVWRETDGDFARDLLAEHYEGTEH